MKLKIITFISALFIGLTLISVNSYASTSIKSSDGDEGTGTVSKGCNDPLVWTIQDYIPGNAWISGPTYSGTYVQSSNSKEHLRICYLSLNPNRYDWNYGKLKDYLKWDIYSGWNGDNGRYCDQKASNFSSNSNGYPGKPGLPPEV